MCNRSRAGVKALIPPTLAPILTVSAPETGVMLGSRDGPPSGRRRRSSQEGPAMVEGNQDIFHCLKCGRLAYELHGTSPPPACCGQPMVRAVSAVTTTGPQTERKRRRRKWKNMPCWPKRWSSPTGAAHSRSRTFRVTKSCAPPCGLATAVADQFQNEDPRASWPRPLARNRTRWLSPSSCGTRSNHCWRPLSFRGRFRAGPTRFRGWAEVCDRLDALAHAFRRHEETERDLLRSIIHESSARPS